MAKFTAIVLATAALFVGAQAGITARAVTCPPGGGVICGHEWDKYGIAPDTLKNLVPANGGDFNDQLFSCEDGILSWNDRCVSGQCVGYRVRDNVNAFCDIYFPDSA